MPDRATPKRDKPHNHTTTTSNFNRNKSRSQSTERPIFRYLPRPESTSSARCVNVPAEPTSQQTQHTSRKRHIPNSTNNLSAISTDKSTTAYVLILSPKPLPKRTPCQSSPTRRELFVAHDSCELTNRKQQLQQPLPFSTQPTGRLRRITQLYIAIPTSLA